MPPPDAAADPPSFFSAAVVTRSYHGAGHAGWHGKARRCPHRPQQGCSRRRRPGPRAAERGRGGGVLHRQDVERAAPHAGLRPGRRPQAAPPDAPEEALLPRRGGSGRHPSHRALLRHSSTKFVAFQSLPRSIDFTNSLYRIVLEAQEALSTHCSLEKRLQYLSDLPKLEDMDVPQGLTRVHVWTNSMVRRAISQDTGSDGSFGNAPLKPEFACNMVQHETERVMGLLEDAEAFSSDEPNAVEEQTDINFKEVDADKDKLLVTTVQTEQFSAPEASVEQKNDDGDATHGEEQEEPVGKQSILFADRGIMQKFIEVHTPSNCTEELGTRRILKKPAMVLKLDWRF